MLVAPIAEAETPGVGRLGQSALDGTEPPRTPLSIGVAWASRITSLALEFVVPSLAGWWIDGRLGSRPWGTLLGTTAGFALGLTHLLQIARGGPRSRG